MKVPWLKMVCVVVLLFCFCFVVEATTYTEGSTLTNTKFTWKTSGTNFNALNFGVSSLTDESILENNTFAVLGSDGGSTGTFGYVERTIQASPFQGEVDALYITLDEVDSSPTAMLVSAQVDTDSVASAVSVGVSGSPSISFLKIDNINPSVSGTLSQDKYNTTFHIAIGAVDGNLSVFCGKTTIQFALGASDGGGSGVTSSTHASSEAVGFPCCTFFCHISI